MKRLLTGIACAGGIALLSLIGAQAQAQNYPNKPIRWVLGFPGGGTSDILGRAIGVKMSESMGQQIIIDNRPGASGIIANTLVAEGSNDGYTMLLVSSTFANLISLGKKVPYDPNALVPVSFIASVPNILAVHPSLPVKNVKDLIELAKKRPGEINYGTGGAGTGPHLATELFRLMTGVNIVHIPYKGTPPAVNDLLAGRVQMMFALSPVAMQYVRDGRLRALAVSGSKRMAELPDTPTVADSVPGYEATVWYGAMVARGTPKPIIDRLNREISNAANAPEVSKRLEALGFQIETGSADDFKKYIASETQKWAKVIAEAHIKP